MLIRGALVAGLVMAVGLATAAQAKDRELTPTWGYASVDDHPFEADGALLPVTQAFPRGRIKDAGTPDGFGVRLTVFAFSATAPTSTPTR